MAYRLELVTCKLAVTNAVTKRVDYAYRGDGTVASVTRYAGAGVNPVATTESTFDGLGRVVGMTHTPAADAAISHAYAYDAAGRVVSLVTPDGTSSFTLDATDQLLSASLTGESYGYDATGNRTGGGVVTAAGNRLVSDGVYRFSSDAEGNRTAKFIDRDGDGVVSVGDTDVTVYGWDQRNRLVAVSHVPGWTAAQGTAVAGFVATGAGLPGSDLELRYSYDYADRRIRRAIDADGLAGVGQESVSYAAYAGGDRTLEIDRGGLLIRDAGGRVTAFVGGVVQRNFYGPGEDEVLAVDRISGATTTTFWTLADRQGTVRDIVSGTGGSRGQVVEHRQYDSFGRLVRRTVSPAAGAASTTGVGVEFGYAGRPLEERTGLSDNRARWYEPATGRFVNEDPSGFKGDDANLFRYVGNDPLGRIDPSGLAAKWAQQAGRGGVPAAGWAGLGMSASGGGLAGGSTLESLFAGMYSSSQARNSAATRAWAASGSAGMSGSGLSGLTVSGITPWQPSTAVSVTMPTYSLSGAGTAVSRPTSSAMGLSSATPFSSLVTSGRSAPAAWTPRPAVESTRWTANDRAAKLAAAAAYDVNDGGLLRAKGLDYDPNDRRSGFSQYGFSAHLTYSETTKTYYLAFRGTEKNDGWDVWADVWQGVGFRTSQFEQAIELTRAVQSKLGDARLVLTGHSLGAAMAAAAAYATGVDATVFNPASVSAVYRAPTRATIRSHVIFGDILSVGRTISNGIPDPSFPTNNVRFAPGEIIVHPPRYIIGPDKTYPGQMPHRIATR